nr:hypothetical protein [uncultured Paracoccus sp.]
MGARIIGLEGIDHRHQRAGADLGIGQGRGQLDRHASGMTATRDRGDAHSEIDRARPHLIELLAGIAKRRTGGEEGDLDAPARFLLDLPDARVQRQFLDEWVEDTCSIISARIPPRPHRSPASRRPSLPAEMPVISLSLSL